MSNQLDRLFADIDELLEGNETPEPGIVRGAPTAQGIRRQQGLPEGVVTPGSDIEEAHRLPEYRAYIVGRLSDARLERWLPRRSVWQTDDTQMEELASACTFVYGNQGRIHDICNLMELHRVDFYEAVKSDRYYQVVKARLEAVGVEGLKDRADRWINIAKAYAGYYRIGIAKIRQILNEIDPEILG